MSALSKIRIRHVFVAGLVFFLVLLFSAPFAVNKLINTPSVRQKISDAIYDKTKVRIETASIGFNLLPQPCLKLDNLKLDLSEQLTINVQQIRLHAAFKALIQGKVNIEKVLLSHPKINYTHSTKKSSKTNSYPSFDIPSFYEKLISFLPKDQDSFKLIIKHLDFDYFDHLDSVITLSKKKGELSFKTTIDKLNIQSSFFKQYSIDDYLGISALSADTLQTKMVMNKSGIFDGNLKFTDLKIESAKKIVLNIPFIESKFSYTGEQYKIKIDPVQWAYPQAKIGMAFSHTPAKKDSQIIFSGNHINVEQARNMATSLFIKSETATTLFQILRKGNVPEISLLFKSDNLSTLLEAEQLTLNGRLENGHINIPETQLITNDTTGIVKLNNGMLDATILKGMLQTSKIKTGHLIVDLLTYDDVPFKGTFMLDLDLAMVPKTLAPLVPGTVLAKELGLIQKLNGRANDTQLDLFYAHNADDVDVKVKTKPFALFGEYDRIPGSIDLKTILFNYDSDVVTLKKVTGLINNSQIQDVHAKIDLIKDSVHLDIKKGDGLLDLSTIVPWLLTYEQTTNLISPVKAAKGQLSFNNLNLTGFVLSPDQWKYSLNGHGQNIFLGTKNSGAENSGAADSNFHIENLAGNYSFSDTFLKLNTVVFQAKDLSWLSPSLEKKHLDSIKLPLTVTNLNLDTTSKKAKLKTNIGLPSGANIEINLTGEDFDTLALNSLTLVSKNQTAATLTATAKNKTRLYDFKGKISTDTLQKILISDSYLDKKLNEITNGEVLTAFTDAKNNLNINTNHINLDAILDKPSSASVKDSPISSKIIRFKADTLKLKGFNFTDVDSTLTFNKNHSYIRLNQANLCDLKTGGYLNIKDDLVYANFPFEATDKPQIQTLLNCLFGDTKFMEGPYSLNFSLNAASPKEKVAQNFKGSFDLRSQKGRIYKLTLLSRILSVLNLSKLFKGSIPNLTQDGFAYKDMIIEGEIKESRLHLTKAVIDGEDMTLIFSGWIDPINDKLELTILVAPFKTIDLIVKNIPIINSILGGRLVSVPVQATGSLKDPNVIPLHPSAVGKGLVDLMSGILKAPINIWDSITPDKESDKKKEKTE